jgi:hypothetical protein
MVLERSSSNITRGVDQRLRAGRGVGFGFCSSLGSPMIGFTTNPHGQNHWNILT